MSRPPQSWAWAMVAALLVLVAANESVRASDKAHGPFKPVVARQRIIYLAEDGSGAEKVITEYVGTYLRSSDGSEIATLGLPTKGTDPAMAGVVPAQEGRLRIGKEGTTYKLDYKKHTATLVATQRTPLTPHDWDKANAHDVVGHQNLDGRKCTGFTLRSHGDETGTAWRDVKDDILVRLESFIGSKEDHLRVVMDRFDIDTREEPDASLFNIPAKWTVIAPAAPEPVSKP